MIAFVLALGIARADLLPPGPPPAPSADQQGDLAAPPAPQAPLAPWILPASVGGGALLIGIALLGRRRARR